MAIVEIYRGHLLKSFFAAGVDKIGIGPDRTGPDHRSDHGSDHGPDHGPDQGPDHGSDHGSDQRKKKKF